MDKITEEKLKEIGVDIEDGVERFSGNREAYLKYLAEFFTDTDLMNCKQEILNGNVEEAFDYAHAMKGLSGNLSINNVYEKLVHLVEILRLGTIVGAMEAYNEMMIECHKVQSILEEDRQLE